VYKQFHVATREAVGQATLYSTNEWMWPPFEWLDRCDILQHKWIDVANRQAVGQVKFYNTNGWMWSPDKRLDRVTF
jgi:hypothetical protein